MQNNAGIITAVELYSNVEGWEVPLLSLMTFSHHVAFALLLELAWL